MIYDGTNLEVVRAQARQGRIFAVSMTWRKHRIYKTKRECSEHMRRWAERHRRKGWVVTSRGEFGSIAVKGEERKAIALHEYNAETLARVYKAPRRTLADKASSTANVATPSASRASSR